MPDKPYISIPALAAYLKTREIQVDVLDANIEFYHSFLSPEHIAFARFFTETRLLGLNEKPELTQLEGLEYKRLIHTIRKCTGIEDNVFSLFAENSLSNVGRLQLFRKALTLAGAPFFPEMIEFTASTGYVRYISKANRFSSEEIIKNIHETSLFTNILKDILMPVLEKTSAPVIGISVAFPDQILPAFQCAAIIKNYLPNAHVTMGGAFISCHMRELKNPGLFDSVDSFVLDEGEIPLEQLIREMSSPEPDLSRVSGLVYLRDGKIVKNSPAAPVDMNLLPAPDYESIPLDRYLMPANSMALLVRLSRGCYWARCTFCKTRLPYINDYQPLSTDNVYEHIRSLHKQFNINVFQFTDDSASPEVLEEISKRIINDRMNIRWVANLRIDPRLTMKRFLLFRQAGCHALYFGVESYNDRILKLMNKGISESMIDKTLQDVSWSGINDIVYMIVGFPSETKKEARDSFERIKSYIAKGCIANCIYNVFEISPFSAIYDNPEKFGITDTYFDHGSDLLPPIIDFKSSGMSREEAIELFLSFNRELGVAPEFSKGNQRIEEELTVNGKAIRLNPGHIKEMDNTGMRFLYRKSDHLKAY